MYLSFKITRQPLPINANDAVCISNTFNFNLCLHLVPLAPNGQKIHCCYFKQILFCYTASINIFANSSSFSNKPNCNLLATVVFMQHGYFFSHPEFVCHTDGTLKIYILSMKHSPMFRHGCKNEATFVLSCCVFSPPANYCTEPASCSSIGQLRSLFAHSLADTTLHLINTKEHTWAQISLAEITIHFRSGALLIEEVTFWVIILQIMK